MFPHWTFAHSERWYPGFSEKSQAIRELCKHVPDDHWGYMYSKEEISDPITVFCWVNISPPKALEHQLTQAQKNVINNIRSDADRIPRVPNIFLSIISDFVDAIIENREEYSPLEYIDLLFRPGSTPDVHRFPIGVIDRLEIVYNLIKTLGSLWERRACTALTDFVNFRFVGLGLLQARRYGDTSWTTIIAYCGGTLYETDGGGKILLSGGRPKQKGKCGYTPLTLGHNKACHVCGKLKCRKCGFCSVECREDWIKNLEHEPSVEGSLHWQNVPIGEYEDYFWGSNIGPRT
jgi:hypothetical protein